MAIRVIRVRQFCYSFQAHSRVEFLSRGEEFMNVRATNLRHAYGDRVTLNGVSFELSDGARVALTGRNGAGKTT